MTEVAGHRSEKQDIRIHLQYNMLRSNKLSSNLTSWSRTAWLAWRTTACTATWMPACSVWYPLMSWEITSWSRSMWPSRMWRLLEMTSASATLSTPSTKAYSKSNKTLLTPRCSRTWSQRSSTQSCSTTARSLCSTLWAACRMRRLPLIGLGLTVAMRTRLWTRC